MTGTVVAGTLRLGTRRSALALVQSGQVAEALRAGGLLVDLVEVTTAGDRSAAPLAQIGGTGVFVSALRERLLAGEVDFAVHSLKDLPSAPAAGVTIAAVPVREAPSDALVSRAGRLADLPAGAVVGTGSPRRAAQLRRARPDLQVVEIRGNVDTRVGRVSSGELHAVVLAEAGLRRLGLSDRITEVLDPKLMLPAPGQGALAVECRSEDRELMQRLCEALDDPATRAAVTAERAVLARLEAGCTAPVGALATVEGRQLHLTAAVVAGDGSSAVQLTRTAAIPDAENLGRELAEQLIAAGAAGLIGEEA